MRKKHKTWYSNLPWGNRVEIIEDQKAAQERSEDGISARTTWISFPALWKSLKKLKLRKKNTNKDTNKDTL